LREIAYFVDQIAKLMIPRFSKFCSPTISMVLILFLSVGALGAQEESRLIADGATLKKVASEYKFTEGPASDAAGNVYFTDQPNDRIIMWSVVDQNVYIYMKGTGRSNGLYINNEGHILACADLNNELWEIDHTTLAHKVLVSDFEGKKLNGPNDLWMDSKGGIYFTDPFYKRAYWTRTEKEIEEENVYYLSPDRKHLQKVADGFVRPNGIVGSKNGKKLYVADIGDKKIYQYKIGKTAKLGARKQFADMGSDGMTTDSKGNIYLTGKGVTIFNKKGKKIGHIDVPENWSANVCFGGKNQSTLFITAMGSLYTIEMKMRGIRW